MHKQHRFDQWDTLLRQAVQRMRQNGPAQALELLRPLASIESKQVTKWINYKTALAYYASALAQCGRSADALDAQTKLLRLLPGDREARRNFLDMLRAVGPVLPASPEFRLELLRALKQADTGEFAVVSAWALRHDGDFEDARQRLLAATDAAAIQALKSGALRPILQSPILLHLMRQTVIPLPEFEILLCRLRRTLLLAYDAAGKLADTYRPGKIEREFIGALAHYVWITEYVFAENADERELRRELQARVEAVLAPRVSLTEPLMLDLAMLALYRPWDELKGGAALLDIPTTAWKPFIQPLLIEWLNEREEQALRPTLESLTPLSEGISALVRQQYEENPYPRWKHATAEGERVAPMRWLQRLAPGIDLPNAYAGPIDVLIAGCGTGLEAINLVRRIEIRRMLAIDLSRASLAYALRMSKHLGLAERIEFKQADILNLDALPDRFDLICSSGVLHHLENPMAGWQALTRLLKPGGFMLVGLYSESACRPIARARQLITEKGWQTTPEQMRKLRMAILGGEFDELHMLTRWRDFYSLSMFRDLVFHVHEHHFTLPMIKQCLCDLGLTFIGMEGLDGSVRRAYRERFPNDPEGSNLDHWALFEEQHPLTFVNMYSILVQKPSL